MAEIQLLINEDSNRHALATLLESHHTPIIDTEVRDADLYLIDDRALPRYREAIETHKRKHHPVFCPVVLIRREHTQISSELPEPDATSGPLIVNEILTAPVEKAVLFRRLSNLLIRRNQTKELQEKTERLDGFAGKLRHELRNPLNILDGYLTLAREDGAPEHFEKCKRAIDRMDRMIDQLLLVARDGNVEVEVEPVDFPAVLNTSWEAIRAPQAKLEIETKCRIYADKDRLHELIENLFRNAIEHGGTDVTITVGDLDDGFYVEDDGAGISESERHAVFQKGYSTGRHGTGLGLTIVEKISEAHGWDISVTGGTKGGARFEISGVKQVADEK